MSLLSRLDAVGTGDGFRKPRQGDCQLCRRPALTHPTWAHRRAALRELVVRKIDRALLILAWH